MMFFLVFVIFFLSLIEEQNQDRRNWGAEGAFLPNNFQSR